MLRNKIKQIKKKKVHLLWEVEKKKTPEERWLEKGEDHLQFNRKKTPTDLTHVAQSTPPPLPPLPTLFLAKHRRSFKSQVTVVPSSKLAGASSLSSRVQYATTVKRFCVCFCSQGTLKLHQTFSAVNPVVSVIWQYASSVFNYQ